MHTDPVTIRIIEAAEAEFAQHGFHQTVVSNIAARAKVGKGTVYRRFGDKQSLFTALISRGMTELQDGLRSALDRESDPKQALINVLDAYFDFFDQAQDLIAITFLEGVKLTNEIHEAIKKDVHRVMALFSELFAQGMERGVFRAGKPDRLAFLFHEFIWSILRGAVFFGYNPRQEYGPDMVDVFLYGISPRAENDPEREP